MNKQVTFWMANIFANEIEICMCGILVEISCRRLPAGATIDDNFLEETIWMGWWAMVACDSFGVHICYNSVNLLKARQWFVVETKRQDVKLLIYIYPNTVPSVIASEMTKSTNLFVKLFSASHWTWTQPGVALGASHTRTMSWW